MRWCRSTRLGCRPERRRYGHRFLADGVLVVLSADLYAEQMLEEGCVIVSFAERRAKIQSLLAR